MPSFLRAALSLVAAVVVAGCPGPSPKDVDELDGGLGFSDGGSVNDTGSLGDAGAAVVVIDAGSSAPLDAGPQAPKMMTVTGEVISRSEFRIVGATVVISGKGSTTTGPGGAFTFTDVTPPYDIAVVTSVGGKPAATIYKAQQPSPEHHRRKLPVY